MLVKHSASGSPFPPPNPNPSFQSKQQPTLSKKESLKIMSSQLNSDLNHPPSPDFDLQSSDSDDYLAFSLRTQPSSKRPRTSGRVRKPAIDRITALPESLLLHLLSFLPIEDAIKTQVLSKRWQYLWTYSTSLVFRDSSDFGSSDKSVGDFVEFVDKTIVLCTCSKLKKFGVRFAYEPDYASNVCLWIRFATGRGTEELQLDFDLSNVYEDDSYLLPQHLYTNSSFKALKFSVCTVMPKGVVCWNSLKKLTIGWVNLSEDVIQKILVGSPVLEIMELYYFYGFNSLRVSNASVKKLILRDVWEHEEQEVEEEYRIDGYHSVIEISAPHLHLLEISGSLGDKIYRLGNVSSLVDAILNFHVRIDSDDSNDYERYSNMLGGLLRSLLRVKKITLGTWGIELLGIMEEKGLRSPLLKCECLTLYTPIRKSVLPGIAHMLESSHNLKTLVITMPSSRCPEHFWEKFPGLRNFDEEHYWTPKYRISCCLIFCLQKVKFIGLVGSELDLYLSFVQFILKNAMVLQKMVIDKLMESCQWKEEFVRAAQKLLSFPRASRNAVVLFYQ